MKKLKKKFLKFLFQDVDNYFEATIVLTAAGIIFIFVLLTILVIILG